MTLILAVFRLVALIFVVLVGLSIGMAATVGFYIAWASIDLNTTCAWWDVCKDL